MQFFGLFVGFVAHFAKHSSSILLPTCLQCITFTNSPIMQFFGLFVKFVVHFAKDSSSVLLPTCLQCITSHKLTHHAILWTFREACCALFHQALPNLPLADGLALSLAHDVSSPIVR
ncbi:MAG: hypothetical protein LBJ95_02360 [Oscillospiraceae bacterium]|jgi:hypothetical protein|nr:hypothetical protein [Oscillospiraceae bacterium]